MAGFFIPWECGLARKREVIVIARRLGVTPREAAAMCMEVWEWAQDQSVDGLVSGLVPADVSSAVGIPGIGEAMVAVGWIAVSDSCIQFPNWERFNGKTARERFLQAARQRHYRQKQALERAARRDARP